MTDTCTTCWSLLAGFSFWYSSCQQEELTASCFFLGGCSTAARALPMSASSRFSLEKDRNGMLTVASDWKEGGCSSAVDFSRKLCSLFARELPPNCLYSVDLTCVFSSLPLSLPSLLFWLSFFSFSSSSFSFDSSSSSIALDLVLLSQTFA